MPDLVMPPLRMRLPLESSLGNTPLYPISFRALSKREEMLPSSAAIVTAEICATPRNACRPRITSCIGAGASFTTSTIDCSNRLTRSPMCSHFVQTIQQRGFLRRLCVADLLEPLHVTFRPRLHSQRWTPARTQQELGQPMPRAQLILLGRLPLPDKIAQCFGIFIRNPHRSQITGAVTARQLQRIPPVGLDAISGLLRNQRRRHHRALDSQLRQLPVKYEARRAGFIAGPQMLGRTKLA